MIEYVTGRGRRVHMRNPDNIDMTVCGVRWDQMVARNAVDREDMCHNCLATYAWSNAGGDAALPPSIVEPQTITPLAGA